jgi:hypothetical protein
VFADKTENASYNFYIAHQHFDLFRYRGDLRP